MAKFTEAQTRVVLGAIATWDAFPAGAAAEFDLASGLTSGFNEGLRDEIAMKVGKAMGLDEETSLIRMHAARMS